jgi:hypothetical protein
MVNRSAARESSVLPIRQQRQDGGDLKSPRTSDDRVRLGRYLPPCRHRRSADYNAVRRSKSGINDAQAVATETEEVRASIVPVRLAPKSGMTKGAAHAALRDKSGSGREQSSPLAVYTGPTLCEI